MSHYMEKIEKLASAAGYPINLLEAGPLMTRENEIHNILAENASKREALKSLDDTLEKTKIELKAEKEVYNNREQEFQADIERFNQKNMILVQYLSTLESDEFELNKLKTGVERNHQEFYMQLKSIVEKARSVKEEIEKLQCLQEKCDQLRQQTIK